MRLRARLRLFTSSADKGEAEHSCRAEAFDCF
jgi:hypothetical protein